MVMAAAEAPGCLLLRRQSAGYREILAIGSPLAWGSRRRLALLVLAFLWARTGWRVRGPAARVIVAALATYLPWLALQGNRSQVFLWYILPTIPFLYAAVGAGHGAGPGARLAARVVGGVLGVADHRPVRLLPPVLVAPCRLRPGRLAGPDVVHRLRPARAHQPSQLARRPRSARATAHRLVLDLSMDAADILRFSWAPVIRRTGSVVPPSGATV